MEPDETPVQRKARISRDVGLNPERLAPEQQAAFGAGYEHAASDVVPPGPWGWTRVTPLESERESGEALVASDLTWLCSAGYAAGWKGD